MRLTTLSALMSSFFLAANVQAVDLTKETQD